MTKYDGMDVTEANHLKQLEDENFSTRLDLNHLPNSPRT